MLSVIRVFLVGLLNNAALRSLAWKYFLKTIIMTALPLAIMAGMNMFVSHLIDWTISKVDSVDPSGMPVSQLPGLAAYLWVSLGLDVGMSALLGAFATKFMMRCIPFLRV